MSIAWAYNGLKSGSLPIVINFIDKVAMEVKISSSHVNVFINDSGTIAHT